MCLVEDKLVPTHASGLQVSIKDLARHIKRVPQYQKELRGVSV